MKAQRLILGLLARQPMSGYDIKRLLENLEWLVSSPSFGSLYPALHAMSDQGLLTMDVVRNGNGPSRKVYRITDAGRRVLREWIAQPEKRGLSLKAFLTKLVLADNLSGAELVSCLQRRRSQVSAYCDGLDRGGRENGEATDLGWRLARDYSQALADAELAWLERALERLSRRTLIGGTLDA
jgi:DNA-binding PadR family transcriptional regulator